MSERKTASSTVSMKGGGYYSQHTRGAKDVIDNTAALAIEALGAIDVARDADRRRPFSIADFGSADGGTSVDLVRKLIAGVRERAPSRPVTVTYTDLPRNDFSAIFAMV
ncbi:MAG: SAM-dependent methyltransferase, partial [Gammaproteobacteria bacterium]|nr:SAM-dependent methyltransferase [Gammaproteobacteria bacterium]